MFSQSFSMSHTVVQRLCVCAVLVGCVAALWSGLSQADAPSDQYTITAETVTDNFTGLVWQRVVPDGTFTQAQAITFCNDLMLAGASDWRLPHILELQSIVDDTRKDPAIDTTAFPDTSSEEFWSSTPILGAAGRARSVPFGLGDDSDSFVNSDFRVRCVR